ncbi:hypothetical protein ACFLVP_04390 [Chloroflexota bacterium]
MHAHITEIHLKSDKVDEAIKVYEDNVIPARRSGKGCLGGYLLIDRKSGKGIAVTLWTNEEDNLATVKTNNYLEQISKFQKYFAAHQVNLGDYEVCTQG